MERHRLFEAPAFDLSVPTGCWHAPGVSVAGSYGGGRRAKRGEFETLGEVAPRDRYAAKHERKGGYVPRSLQVQRELLGTPWMSAKGCQLSVPPFYTQHIGRQMLAQLGPL